MSEKTYRGKYLIVHSSDVNPCLYSVVTLQEHGILDGDLTKAFARLIQRKHEEFRFDESQCYEWPLSPSCLLKKFENIDINK